MHASVGDRIVIKGHHVGEPDRDAEILEVHGLDGSPPYVVRWSDDGHVGLFFPGSDASVQGFPSEETAEEAPEPGASSGIGNEVQELGLEECLELLESHRVGRIAVLEEGTPVIVPVNYRLVQVAGLTWVTFCTRFGGLIECAPLHVAFEIDEIDDEAQTGWSVLVRGTLHHVDAEAADFRERFGSTPWVDDRDVWMLIQPFRIAGRRLTAHDR